MISVPIPPGTDTTRTRSAVGGVVAPGPGSAPGPGAHLSAGDAGLNGEPSGMQGPVVGTPSSTAGPTTREVA